MSDTWEVLALRYAGYEGRKRGDSFIFDDNNDAPHAIDYFIWVLRSEDRVIVVDTGFDDAEGAVRGRPVTRHPAEALAAIGIRAEDVDTLIITHLHYDHAGGLSRFPNATIHLQAAEMAYVTGPCMCHQTLRWPYTVEHIVEAVRRVYSGRVIFHDGDGQVADGVTLHKIGGHSRGMQAVRVRTAAGWMCLASDATHFYENVFAGKPFPIVVDLQEMLDGFETIQALASDRSLLIPGHDPLVCHYFPQWQGSDFVFRLDQGPTRPFDL